MKIVICSIDFRAYFPPRIKHFGDYLKQYDSTLEVIELFQESICYQFTQDSFGKIPHHVLFEGRYNSSISMKEINLKLREKLDKIRPDAIISGDVNLPCGAEILRWTRKNKKGMIIFTNSRKDTFPKNFLVTQVKKSLLRGVEAVLIPAPAWDESMKWLGFKQEQIFYGLNTADNSFWGEQVSNTDFPELPERYFLTLGRHVKMKNLPQFAQAYKDYRNRGGTYPLVMVGDGYTHDEIVAVLKDVPDVIFLPFQPKEKVRQIFRQARVLFLPSYKIETWGMVVNEAMAGGVPIAISNQCGASTTLVKEGENGFIYDPDDQARMIQIMFQMEKMSMEVWKKYSTRSVEIVQDWGVERFSSGSWEACKFAVANHKKSFNPFDWIIRLIWRGRIASDDL